MTFDALVTEAAAATFPPRMVVTEGWPPNAARARARLSPRGVEVAEGSWVRFPATTTTATRPASRPAHEPPA